MKKPLILAAVSGLLAAVFIALYLNSIEVNYKRGSEKTKVLLAKQYIEQGIMLDESLVEEGAVPKSYIQPKALSTLKELTNSEGKKVYMALAPIERGEQIIMTKLAILGLDTGLSAIIPNDKRAVTLTLNSEDISGLIKPGNRVDIIAVIDYTNKENRMQEAATTILQNILVLSISKSFLGGNSNTKEKREFESALAEARVPVGLSVTPQEAELLALASEKGVIKFSLRPTGDDKLLPVHSTRMQDIFRDISAVTTTKNPEANIIHSKQKEAIELLNKYKKN